MGIKSKTEIKLCGIYDENEIDVKTKKSQRNETKWEQYNSPKDLKDSIRMLSHTEKIPFKISFTHTHRSNAYSQCNISRMNPGMGNFMANRANARARWKKSACAKDNKCIGAYVGHIFRNHWESARLSIKKKKRSSFTHSLTHSASALSIRLITQYSDCIECSLQHSFYCSPTIYQPYLAFDLFHSRSRHAWSADDSVGRTGHHSSWKSKFNIYHFTRFCVLRSLFATLLVPRGEEHWQRFKCVFDALLAHFQNLHQELVEMKGRTYFAIDKIFTTPLDWHCPSSFLLQYVFFHLFTIHIFTLYRLPISFQVLRYLFDLFLTIDSALMCLWWVEKWENHQFTTVIQSPYYRPKNASDWVFFRRWFLLDI